jgi:transketolase
MGWCRYVGTNGAVIGITGFGASAPGGIVMEKYGFTVEHVLQKSMELLKI